LYPNNLDSVIDALERRAPRDGKPIPPGRLVKLNNGVRQAGESEGEFVARVIAHEKSVPRDSEAPIMLIEKREYRGATGVSA